METFLASHTGMCTLMVSLRSGRGHSWGHTVWGENDTGGMYLETIDEEGKFEYHLLK